MRLLLILTSIVVLMLGLTGETQAHHKFKTYAHAAYVCKVGKNGSQRHACKYMRKSIPVGEAALRAYINDDCLEDIIEWETAGTWSPTIYNWQGSGAYGLPQALPGHKMASAGADWRTNPITQIKWMIRYVNQRYGGSCAARSFKIAYGWY